MPYIRASNWCQYLLRIQEDEIEQLQSTMASGASEINELVAAGMSAPYAALLLNPLDDMAMLAAAALLFTHLLRVPVGNPGRRALCQALHDTDRRALNLQGCDRRISFARVCEADDSIYTCSWQTDLVTDGTSVCLCSLIPALLEVATSRLPLNKLSPGARERKAARSAKDSASLHSIISGEKASAAQETADLLMEDLLAGKLPVTQLTSIAFFIRACPI